jgi:D-alanyl-D-alanine carboxypeptidase
MPDRERCLAALVLVAVLLVGGGSAASASSAGPDDVVLVARPPLPPCSYLDIKTRYHLLGQWRRTLLDSRLRVWKRYVPDDLVSVSTAGIGGDGRVRSLVIDDLRALAAAARRAGKAVAVRSAYRSYAQQDAVFDSWVEEHGMDYALRYSARPGHSEHQLGTTIDFKSYGGGDPTTHADWATTKAGAWMAANAWRYGWLMSYPKDKRSKTCYKYEPWHYRYVGRELAQAIHDSGLTPREYLWRNGSLAPGA